MKNWVKNVKERSKLGAYDKLYVRFVYIMAGALVLTAIKIVSQL